MASCNVAEMAGGKCLLVQGNFPEEISSCNLLVLVLVLVLVPMPVLVIVQNIKEIYSVLGSGRPCHLC